MIAAAARFYVTGGTLPPGALSYVERQADTDLYEGLSRGEFCYILTSRQMGKSSLMAHTAVRLREEGVRVAVLDLTAIGQNLTPEQWYDGLLGQLGRNLDLEDELEEYWLAHERQSPLQRWLGALREVVLPRVGVGCWVSGVGTAADPPNTQHPTPNTHLVIFVDEIDAVRSLPFSTDEFFAAIRECYNRRSQEPEFARLTFCLLGVATPSDLIQDTRTTPFNIGRRIELTDFTPAEAAPLAAGLRHGDTEVTAGNAVQPSVTSSPRHLVTSSLLARVLYWTGGHPYLTQRLCQAAAEDETVIGPEGVDRLCEELFLSHGARERDDNLLFVRDRLLKSEADRASLLDLYARVRAGKRAADDETNQLVGILRLSGITRVEQGCLRVRNRIYARVFDREWVTAHMPDAELRRQRAAYRSGLLRAATIVGLVAVVMAGLALTALNQARHANQQRHLAEVRQWTLRRYLYGAQMSIAQQAWEVGNVAGSMELLEAQRPQPGQEDLRGFEWRYLWRRCQGDQRATLRGHGGPVYSVAFSPDGKTLATGGDDHTARLWQVASEREGGILRGHNDSVLAVAFSPSSKMLATGSVDSTIRLWDTARRHVLATLRGHRGQVVALAFSPDGRMLASGSSDATVRLWDLASRRELASLHGHIPTLCTCVVFSPNGRILASGSYDKTVKLWDVRSRRELASLTGHTGDVKSVAFSPDGKTLATTSFDSTVRLWDAGTKQEIGKLQGHQNAAWCVAFSPDGKTLATGSDDTTVRLWDVATRREVTTFRGHLAPVQSLAFSPDGKRLATASEDSTVKLWDAAARRDTAVLRGHTGWVRSVAFSPDRRTLASGSVDHSVRLWDIITRREIASLKGHEGGVRSVVFSPDGKTLVSSSTDGIIKLWDVAVRREIATLAPRVNKHYINKVVFSPDGKILASGSEDRTIKLWDVRTKQEVATLRGSADDVRTVAFSPDGKTLAAGSVKNTVTLWDVDSRRELASLRGHKREIMDVAFSPDGKILASSSWDQTIRLWDVATRQAMGTLKGYAGIVDAVAFSPDGRTLAATGVDSTVTLWDVATQQKVVVLRGHTESVTAVAFSPDGNTIASAGFDTTVHLWQAATFQEADPLRVAATGANQAVHLQWWPLPHASAYNVYRGPMDARPAQLRMLTDQPLAETSFTDQSPGLMNGRPQTYAAAGVYRGAAGRLAEGPRVTLQATPVAVPPGWLGCSIQEGSKSGSVVLDPSSDAITLRGAGTDLWDTSDGGYFFGEPIVGDFQITVRERTRPKETHEWAKAGVMLRESLEPGARNASLFTTPAHGLICQWRGTPNDATDSQAVIQNPGPARTTLRLPIVLRLTRRGSTIAAAYSRDDSRSFEAAGEPIPFVPPLPRTLYIGLAITSHDPSRITEAEFSGLDIEKH